MKKARIAVVALAVLMLFAAVSCKEPHVHEFGNWEVTKPATCTEAGVETSTCKGEGCTEKQTREIPKLDHEFIDKVEAEYLKFAATEDSPAVYYKSCKVCGEKGEETFFAGEHKHTYAEAWTTDAENHWHKCKGKDCKEITGKAAHAFWPTLKYDETNHWKECSECGYKTEEVAHVYGAPQVKADKVVHVCDACNYEEKVENSIAVGTESELRTAVENGSKTIYLSDDVTLTGMMEINGGKSIKINLNGKKISIANERINIQNAKVSVEGKGELVRTGDIVNSLFWLYGSMDDVQDYTVLTIGKDVTIRAPYAISVNKNSDTTNTEGRSCGVVVNLQGSIVAENCGLYVNGTLNSSVCAPIFNLTDVVVKSNGCGIYAAGYAKWNIKDTTIEGVGSAIEIRAGELSVDGGSFEATATSYECKANGNGATTSGAAIAVAQHGTGLLINVSIKNTTLKGVYGLAVENPQGNEYEALSKIRVEFDSSVGDPHISADFVNEGNVITAKTV